MKVAFYTLGCKVNSYETASVWKIFEEAGYTRVKPTEKADVYVINTCSVTNQGDAKSRKRIREATKMNKNAIVVVMGCYSQAKPDEVKKIPGVSIIIGNNEKHLVLEKINKFIETREMIVDIKDLLKEKSFDKLEANEFERTRAFLKIQDGCNNFCSYCIIPYVRGALRSKPIDSVIEEAKRIVEKGYKEIVLAGIHTGAYGKEGNSYSFTDLVRELIKIDGLKRLRISSIEINEITDELLNLFKSSNVLCHHLHLPLQSGSDGVLKRMNRKYDKNRFKEEINKIRAAIPDIAITTDVIVGFPGETIEEFNESVNFIKEIGFFMLHVFPYSKREKTKAAVMPNQIPEIIKSKRVNELISLNEELMINYAKKFIGKKLTMIPEVYQNGNLIGHTSNYLLVSVPCDEELLGEEIEITLSEAKIPQNIGKF